MREKGVTMNYSHIIDGNGHVEAGIHFKNTDGVDITVENAGDNFFNVISELYTDTVDKVLEAQKVEENIEDDEDLYEDFLIAENQQLREEIDYLRDRCDQQVMLIDTLYKDIDDLCDENDVLFNELETNQCCCKKEDISLSECVDDLNRCLDFIEKFLN